MQVPLTQYACVTATESRPEDFASVLQLSLALMSLYIKQECVEYCETSPTVQRGSVKYSQVTQIKSALKRRTEHISLIQIVLSEIRSTSYKLVIILMFAPFPRTLYIFLVASSFTQRCLASLIQTSLVLEVLLLRLAAKASSNIML